MTLDDFTLEPFEKPIIPKDMRGYLYIVEDSVFPDHIKIGRANDLKKRLAAYNTDKPYSTVRYSCISLPFVNVISAESLVLEKIYEEIVPIGNKLEWFDVSNRKLLEKWIKIAEESLECF